MLFERWIDMFLHSIETGVVEFDDFLKIVLEHRSTENTPNEILSAFKLYDTQRHGYIDAKQLRYILTHTGEKLTDKDGKNLLAKKHSFE